MTRLYLRLLLVIAVIAPMYWLIFTEDGQRRADSVMLALFADGSELNLSLAALQSNARIEDFKENFPDLNWQCETNAEAPKGLRCRADVTTFNQIPAWSAQLDFVRDRLLNFSLRYRSAYQQQMRDALESNFGTAKPSTGGSEELLVWRTEHGRILVPAKDVKEKEVPALVWVANLDGVE